MAKTPSKRSAWWLPLLSAVCISAQAHTPYLLPASFEAQPRAVISVDASFADKFFIPEVAFGETRFTVMAPDGSVTPMADVRQFKTRTVAEHQLPDEKGTYRVSTGPRLGAVFRSWERNGKVETARDPATPTPADARLLSHYQSLSVSETYITVGKPSRAALAPSGKGLEIVPVTHPADLFAGEKFDFTVQYDGKPLAAQKVEIFRSAMDHRWRGPHLLRPAQVRHLPGPGALPRRRPRRRRRAAVRQQLHADVQGAGAVMKRAR
nr:DUF4198 domain-containing protein [Delftia acidovorans]